MQARAEVESRYTFTTNEVASITGATLRQLQWWCENAALEPDIAGHNRQWTLDDVIAAGIVSDLMRRGMRMTYVKSVLLQIQSESGRYAVVEFRRGSKHRPRVIVGNSLQEITARADVWDSPIVVIDTDIRGKVTRSARQAVA